MTQQYIIHQRHPRLLLFFAGWAADATPFAGYRPHGADYMVCYDYRTLSFDPSILRAYNEVHIVGWSMGVWAAAHLMAELGDTLPPGERIAFNGTPLPIHEAYGIPPEVYRLTLYGLTPAALQKFMKRMCGSAECFRRFLSVTPRRPFDEIRHELASIREQMPHTPVRPDFTRAYVSTRDVIIYTDHQLRYWQDRHVPVTPVEGAHYHEPTFRLLLENLLFADLPNSYEITYNKKLVPR